VTAVGRVWLVPLLLAILACGAVAALLVRPVSEILTQSAAPGTYDTVRMVLIYATLPRLTMAVLCGAGLGVSGAILQQVLRNPLASPTTLGIDAGARLALGLVTVWLPGLFGLGRDGVALAGSAASTLAVFALVRRSAFSAVAIVVAGLVVSLYCGALSSILVLVKDRYLAGLFIWGSGSLSQQSWDPSRALAVRLFLSALPVAPLLRSLSLLDLGEEGARSLGLNVVRLRVMAITISVALAAFVTSAAGVIGFVGLIAPMLAKLGGARRFGQVLLSSALIGALLLLSTDALVQDLASVTSEFVPTGAVTAVLGSPLLLLLLPRLRRAATRPPPPTPARPLAPARWAALFALAAIGLFVILAVFVGRSAGGEWHLLSLGHDQSVLVWRLPRVIAALAAGGLLAVAGVILQRLTSNELASPEVLEVSAGATLAVALVLMVNGQIGNAGATIAATAGGLAVLAAILMLGRRSGFAPERMLLAGVALSALIDAVVGVLSATGDPRAMLLLGWMAGSTGGKLPADAIAAALSAAVLVPAGLLGARWLAILPLGGEQAVALGVPLGRSRLLLLLLAAVATAAATLIVGPLTFVGLMAPHIARWLGARRPLPALLGSAAVGAGLMAAADWLARTAMFPLQLPTGLVGSIIGAPFLMVLLGRRRSWQ